MKYNFYFMFLATQCLQFVSLLNEYSNERFTKAHNLKYKQGKQTTKKFLQILYRVLFLLVLLLTLPHFNFYKITA